MKKFIVLLLLTSFSLSLTAQPLRKITYKMMIETAEVSMETGDYLNALDYYKMAYEDKKEKEISLKIAQVYYLLKDYKYAANYYKRILRRDKKNEYFEHKLFYGKSLKRLASPVGLQLSQFTTSSLCWKLLGVQSGGLFCCSFRSQTLSHLSLSTLIWLSRSVKEPDLVLDWSFYLDY